MIYAKMELKITPEDTTKPHFTVVTDITVEQFNAIWRVVMPSTYAAGCGGGNIIGGIGDNNCGGGGCGIDPTKCHKRSGACGCGGGVCGAESRTA